MHAGLLIGFFHLTDTKFEQLAVKGCLSSFLQIPCMLLLSAFVT